MITFFLIALTFTVILEIVVLSCRGQRWNFILCSLDVAVVSGIVWIGGLLLTNFGDEAEALAQEPPTFSEELQIILCIFPIFVVLAFITACAAGWIFKRMAGSGQRLRQKTAMI